MFIKGNKLIDYANRGMTLESDINLTNYYYRENDIAIIYKKPIPIKVIKVNSNRTRIIDGFYEEKSTLDYNGIYKGKYIEFDAKETNNKTSYPLANIHKHQLEHIRAILRHGGIVFLIVRFNYYGKTFIIDGNILTKFIDTSNRKSIPYNFFIDNTKEIKLKYSPRLDYLNLIDIL